MSVFRNFDELVVPCFVDIDRLIELSPLFVDVKIVLLEKYLKIKYPWYNLCVINMGNVPHAM